MTIAEMQASGQAYREAFGWPVPADAATRRARPVAGLPASVVLHAALLAWLAFVTIQHFESELPDEQGVEVELKTLEDFKAMSSAVSPPKPEATSKDTPSSSAQPQSLAPEAEASLPPAPASEPRPASAPEIDGMIHPRRLLSQAVLADPRSRETRALLPRLAPNERVEQLCGLEAMGQIHDWQRDYEPDRVAADALAATKLVKLVLTADGAAFRSRKRWYGLRFACTVTPDLKRVTAFAFHVEAPVPRERWEGLGLPTIH